MTRGRDSEVRHLRRLAHLYGIEPGYTDPVTRRRRLASPDTLLAVLRALGAEVKRLEDVPAALRERRQAVRRQTCEPVVVAWEGRRTALALRLPAPLARGPAACALRLESGEVRRWSCRLARVGTQRAAEVEGTSTVTNRLPLPGSLPPGLHRLTVEVRGRTCESLVIAAPRRAHPPPGAGGDWGVFLPLYALHSARSWGSGDLTDLEAFARWVAGLGGRIVATLPLLAAFLDEPFDPSPYAPASRLFWNEFYLDVTRLPDLERCPAAQALLASPALRREVQALRAAPVVDYRRGMAVKRRVLEALARACFAGDSARQADLRRFLAAHPAVDDYARFRAAGEQRRAPWPAWPAPLRDGVLREGDYAEEARRYHLYVQWAAHEQVEQCSRRAREAGARLYLDLPLGVHAASYDVWRERAVFAQGVSGGAPPDAVFTKGQDWGFPPLHPQALREQGYRYYLASLRHQLRHAGLLRIDHVMSLHRLFWIPQGAAPADGVYVRYSAEELYALLTLESRRHRAAIVGENLGTVPPEVGPAMARHHVQRMYVVQYEVTPDRRGPLRPVPADAVASLNTHDMPPFAAFWRGLDIADRRRLSLLTPRAARVERALRRKMRGALARFLRRARRLAAGPTGPAGAAAILRGCLGFLCASPARLVLVSLEDLWAETRPQNVPGTGAERPNWRRKARYAFEAFHRKPRVLAILREVNRWRSESATA